MSEYITWEEALRLEEEIYQQRQERKRAAQQAEIDYWRDSNPKRQRIIDAIYEMSEDELDQLIETINGIEEYREGAKNHVPSPQPIVITKELIVGKTYHKPPSIVIDVDDD